MTWTYNYPIPLDSTNTTKKYSDVYAARNGSSIYIICDTALENIDENRMDIFNFNTQTGKFRDVNYEVPQHLGDILERVEEDADNIYMWRNCFNRSESLLFKLDFATESLTHILSVARRRSVARCPIIGDMMYAFSYDEDGTLHLLTIDLSKEEMVSRTLLTVTKPNVRCHSMFEVNKQLYILDNISNTERKVYKFANGELSLLSHQHFDDDGEDVVQLTMWNGGKARYKKNTENGAIFYTDTFDFEKLTWSREVLTDNPWSCADVKGMITEAHVDGVRYVIKERLGSVRVEYDLQVYENLPKLLTRCYLNIVDEVIQNDNYEELENVKSFLHPLMSYDLDKMTNWKRREKDITTAELKLTQLNAMTERIKLMESDTIIESDIAGALLDIFNGLNIFDNQ